jgi:hypothetical protein
MIITSDTGGVKVFITSPPDPLSKLENQVRHKSSVWRGGKITKRGRNPLLNYFPLPFYKSPREGGHRGIGFT